MRASLGLIGMWLAGAIPAGYDGFGDELAASEDAAARFLLAYKAWFYGVAIVLGAIGTIASRPAGTKREVARALLERLHMKHFPGTNGFKDPSFRLSLYVPSRLPRPALARLFPWVTWNQRLTCLHRTDGVRPRRTWQATNATGYDGVCGYVWSTGGVAVVPALASGAKRAVREEYAQKTYVTYLVSEQRSWRGAGIIAIPVTRDHRTVGVLVAECRCGDWTSGLLDELYHAASVCDIAVIGR